MTFPKNFVWGAATSAYQIEGAIDQDGRGASVWDAMCAQPGRVHGNETGAGACEHYRRSRSDVAIMADLGLKAYRFSIAWPRVIPSGVGAVNTVGLEFYDRLVDELLGKNIDPWVTLFHWDYPLELYHRGGWLNADSPQWFAEYTRVVVDKLSDRVSHWITLNEPQCFVGLGHQTGIHAPGDKLPLDQVLLVAHRVLLAHGSAVQVIRAHARKTPQVGWSPTGDVPIPASERPEDIGAAREDFWAVTTPTVWNQSWWLEPALHGTYPSAGLKLHGAAVPAYTDSEMKTIRQPLDFLGLNIYNGYRCRRGTTGSVEKLMFPPGFPQTHNNWNVTPDALRWGPLFAHERSGLPIVITENGMAGHDWVAVDGGVHDVHRIDYLRRYLRALQQAITAGVAVQGYFAWSLMDNFEWAEGYRYRFGLVHVEYATQQRTLKDSAKWYREVIRTNGAEL
jgi:beta-glucosidase